MELAIVFVKQYNTKKFKLMIANSYKDFISTFPDFPKKGIFFKDISPILKNPTIFESVIIEMSNCSFLEEADSLIAIDARGFIFGSALAIKLKKPLILARKKNKLPGELIEKNYGLEYGQDSLSIQKSSLLDIRRPAIIDDILATGGTANCILDLLKKENKEVQCLLVFLELNQLKGRDNINLPVHSVLKLD